MQPDVSKLYARSIDTTSGKCFCVVVLGSNVDDDGFDVTVFHARTLRTYVGKGIRAPARWIKPGMWMPLAMKALASEASPEGVSFNFNPDTGALSWTWPGREVGMSAGAQQAIALTQLEPGQAAARPLEDMLATVFESCYRLLVSCRQLDGQLQHQADSLTRTRRELQEVTEKHKGLVEELHIKFARVLDAKKEKLIEQQARIKDLEEQLKAARQELAEAEAAHTDEEDAGEPNEEELEGAEPQRLPRPKASPQRRQQQQQQQGSDSAAATTPSAGPPTRQAREQGKSMMGLLCASSLGASLDEMDIDMYGGAAISARDRRAPAAAAAQFGNTYASLGGTPFDEDLLTAETQPAVRVAAPPDGGPAPASPAGVEPPQPPRLGSLAPLATQPQQQQQQAGLAAAGLLRGAGAAVAAAIFRSDDEDGDDADDGEEEDDDAALGLVGRRGPVR